MSVDNFYTYIASDELNDELSPESKKDNHVYCEIDDGDKSKTKEENNGDNSAENNKAQDNDAYESNSDYDDVIQEEGAGVEDIINSLEVGEDCVEGVNHSEEKSEYPEEAEKSDRCDCSKILSQFEHIDRKIKVKSFFLYDLFNQA